MNPYIRLLGAFLIAFFGVVFAVAMAVYGDGLAAYLGTIAAGISCLIPVAEVNRFRR